MSSPTEVLNTLRRPTAAVLCRLTVLLAISVFSGCSDLASLSDAEYVEQARDAYDKGEINTSVIALKNALNSNPDNLEARTMLGRLHIDTGSGAAAEKEFRRSLELGIAREAVTVDMARAYLLQGKNEELLEAMDLDSDLDSRDLATLYALYGHAYLGMEDMASADDMYKRSLATARDLPETGLGMARLLTLRGENSEARKWLDQTLETHPDFAPAWSLLGDLQSSMGEAGAAEASYSQAISHRLNNSEDLLKRALVRIHEKKYEEAKQDIGLLRKKAPNLSGVHYAVGILNFYQGDYQAARTEFENSLNVDDNYYSSFYYLGATLNALGQYRQAEQYLVRFLGRYPGSTGAAKLLGVVRIRLADYDGAEEILLPLIARTPDDVLVHNLLGHAAVSQGDIERGLEHIRKVVELEPDSVNNRVRLGVGLMLGGDPGAGVSQLETAIDLDSNVAAPEIILVMHHIQQQDYTAAEKIVATLAGKLPGSSMPKYLLGQIQEAKGDLAAAKVAYREALVLAPDDLALLNRLAALAVQEDDEKQARAYLMQAYAADASFLPTLLALADLERRYGSIGRVQHWLELAVKEHPEKSRPRVLLGRFFMRTGQPDRALQVMSEVQDLFPGNPEILIELGTAQLENGESRNALSTFKRLVDVVPQSAGARYFLAKTYLSLGNPDQARKEIQQTLALNPDHYFANLLTARMYLEENNLKAADELLAGLQKKFPSSPEVSAQFGELMIRKNRPADAVKAYNAALSQRVNSKWIINLAQAQWQMSDEQGMIATLEKWSADLPADVPVKLALSEAYLKVDRPDASLKALQQALELAPDNILALNNMAWRVRETDPGQAMTYAERAYELAPTVPAVMDTLAVLLLDRGDEQRSVRLSRGAVNREPTNVQMNYHLALALTKTGKDAEARSILQKITEAGGDSTAHEQARELLAKIGK